jgi:hypothetical protein
MGNTDTVKENVDILTEGAGLTRSQTIFQNAVTRAAANYSSIKERVADVFTRSRGG